MKHFPLQTYLMTVAAVSASFAVPLAPQSQLCTNAPGTVAGTTVTGSTLGDRSNSIPRASRNNVIWCAPNSQTYVTLRLTVTLSSIVLKPLLATVAESIHGHYVQTGDGLLAGGGYAVQKNNLVFELLNANNHQCTWGVLKAAVWAIQNFMTVRDMWGELEFSVFDGGNQVAQGTIN